MDLKAYKGISGIPLFLSAKIYKPVLGQLTAILKPKDWASFISKASSKCIQ